jgi:hypothetical protein
VRSHASADNSEQRLRGSYFSVVIAVVSRPERVMEIEVFKHQEFVIWILMLDVSNSFILSNQAPSSSVFCDFKMGPKMSVP